MTERRDLWIGGAWVPPRSGRYLDVIDPASEERIGQAAAAGPADVGPAAQAAQAAYRDWRRVPAVERAELLHRVAGRLLDLRERVGWILSQESGKTLYQCQREVGWCAEAFRFYAELARAERGRVVPAIASSQLELVLKEPLGVVACIVPWNYPLLLATWKVAPSLAAGNTVIVKPSEHTPLSFFELIPALEPLPPGTVNIVSGYGPDLGQPLIDDPHVKLIAFTGSVETGAWIAERAGRRLKRAHLEMGGKDAVVVWPDSDLDVAVKGVSWAAHLNAGQVCTSVERVYVQRDVFGTFTDRLVEAAGSLRLGHPREDGTQIGPMIGQAYRARVEAQLAQAVGGGARVLFGGERPVELPRGYYYRPTVVVDVPPGADLLQKETFGPVAPVVPFQTLEEAIELVNGTPYGLGADLFTQDAGVAKRFFEEVEAGLIWINDPLTDNVAGPFGGMKHSGIGRELGIEGLEEFRQTKRIVWDFEQSAKPWWF